MLRAILISALLGQLVSEDEGAGITEYGSGPTVVFHAALARNGMGAWNDLPANFPTPTVAFIGSAPTLNSVDGTTAFTESGPASSAVTSPLCANGDWASLGSGCMTTRRATGTTLWTGANTLADCTGDCSACAVYRMAPTTGATAMVASENEADEDGWELWHTTGRCGFYVANTAAGAANALCPTGDERAGSWMVTCGTHDYDGNTTAYKNGVAGTPVASPGGTITSATGMRINAGGAAAGIIGDIAAVLYWQSTVLSAAQVASFSAWVMGIHEEKGTTPTFSNTGPTCCWVAGSLQCFSDNFPRKGCEVPPGLTGAGAPTTCAYHSTPSATQRLLQVPTLNTTWTAVNVGGAAVVATSTVSMFADARQIYKATDDDATGHEYIHQTVAKAGTQAVLCVWAATESGAGVVTVAIDEDTGGGCVDAESEVGEIVTSTTTNGNCWAYTYTDAGCSNLKVVLYPVDTDSGVAATGHAAMLAELFTDQAWFPSQFIPTTAAAVTSGVDYLTYDITNIRGMVDGSGNINGQKRFTATYIPFVADNTNAWTIFDYWVAGFSDRQLLQGATNETMVWTTKSGGVSNAAITSSAITHVAGTPEYYELSEYYEADKYVLRNNGTVIGSSTTAYTAPTGQTTFVLGTNGAAAGTADGGACLQDVTWSVP